MVKNDQLLFLLSPTQNYKQYTLYLYQFEFVRDQGFKSQTFFRVSPLLFCRFLICSGYTFGDRTQTVVNLITLGVGVIPKVPVVHKFRLFGINKY